MARGIVKIALVVVAISLSGCAAQQKSWYKDGASQQDFHMDQGQCKSQSFGVSNPSMMQMALIFNSCMQGKGWYLQDTRVKADENEKQGSNANATVADPFGDVSDDLSRQIGSSLDNADKAAAKRALWGAFSSSEAGTGIKWNNPASGHSGTITLVKEDNNSAGEYCLYFREKVAIDGKIKSAFGSACQHSNGTWGISKPHS